MLTAEREILSDDDFSRISAAVRRHCGINLHDGKKELVRGRLLKRLRAGGFSNASAYIRNVLADPRGEEFSNLIDFLSTNLTGFFREPSHFEYLQTTHLPELARRKGESRRIHTWSAGCSSGQEAYTLGIVLKEAFEILGKWDIKILATDISRQMLRLAREGVYGDEQVQSLSSLYRAKYFTRDRSAAEPSVKVVPALRELVRFRYLNLMQTFPFNGSFDFIFCRNVMIYFDKPTQELLVNRFWEHLAPGGLLFTGHSESLTGISHGFRYVQPTIYVKR